MYIIVLFIFITDDIFHTSLKSRDVYAVVNKKEIDN